MYFTFYMCSNFNQPINIPDGVKSLYWTFASCSNFNQPITIPESVIDMGYTFYQCHDFNQPITIPNNVNNLDDTFYQCFKFNQPIIIPKKVRTMGGTFQFCSNFNQPVDLPDGLNSLSSTFSDCSNFNQPVTIPNSVTTMRYAFKGCVNFNQPVVIPKSVTMGDYMFAYCYNFNQPITIPNNIQSVNGFFQDCSNFNQPVVVPDKVNGMVNTFSNCSNLNNNIVIYASNVSNASNCFYNTSLEKDVFIVVPGPYYNGAMIQFANYIYYYYTANQTIDIVFGGINGATKFTRDTVNDYTFKGTQYYAWTNNDKISTCYTNVETPVNLSTYPFIKVNCPFETGISQTYLSLFNEGYSTTERKDGVLLRDINIVDPLPYEPIAEVSNAWTYHNFYNSRGVETMSLDKYDSSVGGTYVVVPLGHTALSNTAFSNSNVESVDLQSIPIAIANDNMTNMFCNCHNLTNISNIPSSITNMSNSFSNCSNFNQPITIPNGVTDLSQTFNKCTNFNQPITIPNSVTNMYHMFNGCSNFNQPITIPESVVNVVGTLNNCRNFNQPVTIPNGVTSMHYTFNNCRSFNQPVTIPESVTDMAFTFGECTNFNQPVTIPESVTSMYYTFWMCSNFNQPITIPNGVTSMGSTFTRCSNFNQPITIPESVKEIWRAFSECSNFDQPITIPNGVTSMSQVFEGCTKFNQPITIPNGVTNLYEAFMDCTNFNQPITIPNGVTNLWQTFRNCTNFNQPITIPNSVTDVYYAFYNCTNLKKDIIIDSTEITSTMDSFYNVSNINIYIWQQYQNGQYTKTYNSFVNAGYINSTNINIIPMGTRISYSIPLGASIFFDGVYYNTSPLVTPKDIINYTCYHPDYAPTTGTLTGLNAVEKRYVDVTMSKDGGVKFTVDTTKYTNASVTYTYGEDNYSVTSNSVLVLPGTEVKYAIKCSGYKTYKGSVIVTSNTTINNIVLEESTAEEVNLIVPFNASEYQSFTLDNFIDDSNWEISGNYIQSGSSSYNKDGCKSYGYIEFITPDEETEVSVSCFTSSESNYDFGGVYVGTELYDVSSNNILRNKTTDGSGSWLYADSGNNDSPTEYKMVLQPNTKYYLQFYYIKDGSSSNYSDRMFISNIKFNAIPI